MQIKELITRYRWHYIYHRWKFFEILLIAVKRRSGYLVLAYYKQNLTTVRRTICTLLITFAMIGSWANTPLQAQELPSDLTKLSLEELMEIEVVSIGVLGGHTHYKGEWMIGYQYMFMRMDKNRNGTDKIDVNDVLQDFMVAPKNMTMEMHMIEFMYAPLDNITLMVMVPFLRLSMDHVNRMGDRFTTESRGIGDITAMALYTFYKKKVHQFFFNAGTSFPIGSVNMKDDTPAGFNQKLPYPMQLGSGTFNLLPGITYVGLTEKWSWGSQASGTIRLGMNSNGYKLGNQLHLTAWCIKKWTNWLAPSVRIDGYWWGNINGADSDLNPAMVPTADPDKRGGKRIDLLFGINLFITKSKLRGQRVLIEGGLPVYQSLNGPQLENDLFLSIGWQWTF